MKYFILLIALAMFGCDKENTKQLDANFSTYFEFSIQDSEGRDLLDPNIEGSFDHGQIKFYNIIEGNEKLLDDNTNLNFITNERGYYTLHCNTNKDTCYIRLSKTIIDTITTKWESGSNYFYNTMMWYNGKLLWEKSKNEFPIVIKILKFQ